MGEAAVGAGLSLGQLQLSALVDLKASIDSQNELMRKYLRAEQEYQEKGPVQVQLRSSQVSPASGSGTLGLGGPKQGRMWMLRRLMIGGSQWGSSVAGTAEIYITSVPSSTDAVARNLADMADQGGTGLPYKQFYGTGQIVLRYPQELKIVIVTPTASTQYIATGAAIDYPDRPARGVFER